jgi:hypothetical protein
LRWEAKRRELARDARKRISISIYFPNSVLNVRKNGKEVWKKKNRL